MKSDVFLMVIFLEKLLLSTNVKEQPPLKQLTTVRYQVLPNNSSMSYVLNIHQLIMSSRKV